MSNNNTNKKFNLSGPLAFAIALLVLAVFVPINLIAAYGDKVIDMTPSGKYTLNPITEKLLDDASDKKLDVYFLSELNDLQEVPRYLPLYHTLTELEKHDNITLHAFDPNKNPDIIAELNPDNRFSVGSGDVFIKCEDTVKWINFKKIFQQDASGILEYAGEELIASAINVCTSGNLPTVYFLTGYSDKTMSGNYSGYADAIKNDNYAVEELDLSTVDEIPDKAAILYLAGPTKDISDSDRDKISAYLDQGGAISMLIPPCDTKGRFENIEYLLSKFEISMDYNIITEENSSYQLRDRDGEQSEYVFTISYPDYSQTNEYSENLTADINTLLQNDYNTYMPGISNTRTFREISSSSALIEKAPIMLNLPDTDPSLAQNMEMLHYSNKSTAMGGDADTKKAAAERSYSEQVYGYYSYNKQSGAKLIVIGSDDIIDDNNFTPHIVGSRVLTLFSNTWLFDSDVSMGIGTKSNAYDTMSFHSGEEATAKMRIFTIVPIAVALLGVVVWLKRRYA